MSRKKRPPSAAWLCWRRAAGLLLEGECRLLVMDEVCAALTSGLLPLEPVLDLLDHCPEDAEVVLTGRNPPPQLQQRADYLTEMTCRRHPYQQGVAARSGSGILILSWGMSPCITQNP